MTASHGRGPFRDRSADYPAPDPAALKPPVLGRSLLRWVCLAALAVVLYGTIGPIGLGGGPWIWVDAPHQLVPPPASTNYNDIFTNYVLYIPVGAALCLLIRRRGMPRVLDFTLAVILAGGLSWGTEWVQQFIPARSASRVDIYLNTIGAGIGALLAPLAQHVIRRAHAHVYYAWHLRPWTLISEVTVGVTVLLMVMPLDFGAFSISFEILRDLDVTDVRRMVVFALAGFALTAGVARFANSAQDAARIGFWRLVALATVLEASQSLLVSHEACVFELFVCIAGGLMGCIAGWVFIDSGTLPLGEAGQRSLPETLERYSKRLLEHAERFRPYAGLLLVLTLPLGALPQIWGLGVKSHPSASLWQWLPFQTHFYAPFHVVIAEVLESLLVYGFLAVLCMFISPERGRKLSALLLVGLVGLMEFYRWVQPELQADMSAMCLAALAWVAAHHAWKALEPRLRPEPIPVAAKTARD